MKKFMLLAFLAVILAGWSFAQVQSLSANPSFSITPSGRAPAAAKAPDQILDAGFENGPPPASSWTEYTNTTCEWIMDITGVWGMPAHTGTYCWWGGGFCGGGPNSNHVEQSVHIPADAVELHFFTCFYRPDPDDPTPDDIFRVTVNGTPLLTTNLVRAADTYPNWSEQAVNVAAYANQTVTLRLEVVSAGTSTGNVLVDDLSFTLNPIPTVNAWGLGALIVLLGGVGLVARRFIAG